MESLLHYDLSLKPLSLEKINEQFTKCRCLVMALGKNRNLSYISQEAVEDALYSLGYAPVVAHLMYDETNDKWFVGGHDRELDENFNFKDLTVPYGVVIKDSYSYEDVEEKSGVVNTYLACDLILWTGRYPDLMKAAYGENCYFGQSMEITPSIVVPYSLDERYVEIKKFTFSCLTLLGKSEDEEYHTEPCFPEAKVIPFQAGSEFNTLFLEMCRQLTDLGDSYQQIAQRFSCLANKEKEEVVLDEKLKALETFGIALDDLNFSIENMSVEELTTKLENFSKEDPDAHDKFELNLIDYLQEIEQKLSQEKTKDDYGYEWNRYWLVDVQDDEVIVRDTTEHYNLYGLTLKKSGDAVDIDFGSAVRKKCKYENFESAEPTHIFSQMETEIKNMAQSYQRTIDEYKANKDSVDAELAAAQENLSKTQQDYQVLSEQYSQLKDQVDAEKAAAVAAEKSKLFERFEKELSGNEEFESLKESSAEIDLSELEKECYALVGRKTFAPIPAKPSSDTAKFSFVQSHNQVPYNGLFEKYRK